LGENIIFFINKINYFSLISEFIRRLLSLPFNTIVTSMAVKSILKRGLLEGFWLGCIWLKYVIVDPIFKCRRICI
jgi:hypothetical protein